MGNKNLPIAFFNGTVATTNGIYRISDIDLESAKKLVDENTYISAIGHEATAEIMTELLGVKILLNRIQFKQKVNQTAIVFKLNERPTEGTILSKKEIKDIGYSLKLMERLE
ncbi:MAG: YddF family protein [Clostridiales bacterium]|nr:YddF family protein [Clostridiales bacterium]